LIKLVGEYAEGDFHGEYCDSYLKESIAFVLILSYAAEVLKSSNYLIHQ